MANFEQIYEILLKMEADEREAEAMDFRSIVTRNEKILAKALANIFKQQKEEVKAKLNAAKAIEDLFMFDTNAWKEDTRKIALKHLKTALNENGERVYSDLIKADKTAKDVTTISVSYEMEYPEALAYLENQGIKLADDVTEETEKLLASLISESFVSGLTVAEIAELIDDVFDDTVRAKMIARTEVVRAANYGALSAYKQSGVVESKEWLTAQDEKVCPYCSHLDGKVIGLDESYLEVGGTLEVVDANGKTHTFTNNYLDTQAPPVHPRCRCTLLPVLKLI